MPRETTSATLRSIHQMTPRVKQFLLQVDGHRFDFEPGQHTMISAPHGSQSVTRPYSPVNLPGTDKIVLAIKAYQEGICSRWMHERKLGDPVPITDFTGNLHLRNPSADAVFLSTGTGITPMLSILRQYLAEGTGQAVFVHGERTQADLMFRETLDQLTATHGNLQVGYVLSEESWAGPTGYVQDHVDTFIDDFDRSHFYLCGVPEMVVATQDALARRGVEEDRILTEGWEAGAVEK